MGLIKAGIGALGGALADAWREFFYCESIEQDTLAVKGEKRVGGRSSNKKGTDNIITNGSIVAVAEGQCMMIVDQGRVTEVSAEPGEFVYNSGTESSVFYGSLSEGLKGMLRSMGRRVTMGGEPGKDQRVYYFNTKEIMGNKYGTPSPVPFRVVDNNIGLDIDISVRCHGEYSYKITNPLLFYANVCGNVTDEYRRENIDSQLKTEVLTALQPAFAKISSLGIRYSAIPAHTAELSDAMNEVLSAKWAAHRGLAIVSFGVNAINASEEDERMIKELQRDATLRNPTMAAARLAGAQAQAMQDAAKNQGGGGAFMGFAAMGMAQNANAGNVQNLFALGQQQAPPQPPPQTPAGAATGIPAGWTCTCGVAGNTGRFCSECGKPKPEQQGPQGQSGQQGWTCACGAVNRGKFCAECGKSKPAGAPIYQCDKCGWTPPDPRNPPKFCPECGDVFNENDAK
ncbi:MAG: SPFH domain-containing protein [Acidobacteriota bacterium]|jgi:membrane protease subunit (stomatin/prohibitin family)|nr:SPFH domain-containing protein [Acidobacteriota bacterium]